MASTKSNDFHWKDWFPLKRKIKEWLPFKSMTSSKTNGFHWKERLSLFSPEFPFFANKLNLRIGNC